jgi:hypothetical protein
MHTSLVVTTSTSWVSFLECGKGAPNPVVHVGRGSAHSTRLTVATGLSPVVGPEHVRGRQPCGSRTWLTPRG